MLRSLSKKFTHKLAAITFPSNAIQTATAVTSAKAQPQIEQPRERWDLWVGVLVERLPIVTRSLTPFEQEYQDYLQRVEFEQSYKSDWELQQEKELQQAELIQQGKLEIDTEEVGKKQTAQDLLDAWTEELKQFKTAPRKTADDAANKLTSTNRRLEDILYVVVEQKLGDKTWMLLPQGQRLDGETMRQAAERVLHEKCGDKLEVLFLGNAPAGFYKYKYPKTMRNSTEAPVGAKVFFYRSTLQQGNVDEQVTKKFGWLDKLTLQSTLPQGKYVESVTNMLVE